MNKVKALGVINLTPNSFSDGGKAFSEKAFFLSIERLIKLDCRIIDIGAESTAPMNEAITDFEERIRLELSFEGLKQFKDQIEMVSLDSYRPKTAMWFFKELRNLGFAPHQFMWNDVSGVNDGAHLDFLESFTDSSYVFSHNLAPERELSGFHMDYLEEGDGGELLEKLRSFFSEMQNSRVYFDPCFGFSKTNEQNLFLLQNWQALVSFFPEANWLLGVSKKSFMRSWWADNIESGSRDFLLAKSEFLHYEFIKNVIDQVPHILKGEVLLRLHDPSLLNFSKQKLSFS